MLEINKMSPSFMKYIVVGGVGFGIDGGVMMALHVQLSCSPMAARLVSFPVAVSVTWFLNRHWTFKRGSVLASARRYGPYLFVQIIGALINLGVFAAAVGWSDFLGYYPLSALAIAALPVLAFTYFASKCLIFREITSQIK
jgi:putative flippase GtrA